jgi:hypothetical protein
MTLPDPRGTVSDIAASLGKDRDPDLIPYLDKRWAIHQWRDRFAYGLRELYTRLDGVDWLLGQTWQLDDVSGPDMSQKRSQRAAALQTMRKTLVEQIGIAEKRGGAAVGIATGVLTRTAPVMGTDPQTINTGVPPDPNEPALHGDPVRRFFPGGE